MDETKERIMRGLICRLAMDSYHSSTNKMVLLEHLGIEDDGGQLTNEKVFDALDRMFGKVGNDATD